jgi:hypothetical protein
MMAFSLRHGVTAVVLGTLLFCISCEKHPLGQMPDVQREQSDPATRDRSKKHGTHSEEGKSSPTPAEHPSHETR